MAIVLFYCQGAADEVTKKAMGREGRDKHGPVRKQLKQERLGTTELCQSGSAPSPAAQQELCGFFLFILASLFPLLSPPPDRFEKFPGQLGQIAR